MAEWEHEKHSASLCYMAVIDNPDHRSINAAFSALIRRHESLRTTFKDSSGTLQQVIHDAETFPFEVEHYDLSDSVDQSGRLAIIQAEFIQSRFDLTKGPLIKAILIKTNTVRHLLGFAIDHIVSDAMSMEILKKEFSAFYHAGVNGLSLDLPALNFQIKDYALWERDYNQGLSGQENLQYWKAELSEDLKEFCICENEFASSSQIQGFAGGGVFDFFIDNVQLEQIRARYGSVSFFMIASLFTWLSEVSGQRKIILAIPFSSRNGAHLENVVGYLMSAVYLRLDVGKAGTFEALLAFVVDKYSQALSRIHYSRMGLDVDIDLYCAAFLNNVSIIQNDDDFDNALLRNADVDEAPYYPIRFDISSYANGWLVSCYYRKSLFKGANGSGSFMKLSAMIDQLISCAV